MKQNFCTTKQQKTYTVKFYKLFLYHSKDKFNNYYERYDEVTTVHSGCFKLEWELDFSSKKKVIEFLKKMYPNTSYVSFYSHLNLAMRGDRGNKWDNRLIISCLQEPAATGHAFTLKNPRKRHPKKRSWHWDDMWNSDSQWSKKVIMERDFWQFHK